SPERHRTFTLGAFSWQRYMGRIWRSARCDQGGAAERHTATPLSSTRTRSRRQCQVPAPGCKLVHRVSHLERFTRNTPYRVLGLVWRVTHLLNRQPSARRSEAAPYGDGVHTVFKSYSGPTKLLNL